MSLETSSSEENVSPESFYSLRLREWSLQIPLIKLSKEWEKSILDLIPTYLKQRHPRRVEKTLMEVRKIYEKDMRNCAIASIIPHSKFIINDYSKIFNLQAKDNGDNSYSVPKQRIIFAKKYFLSHSIMKHIIEAASTLPPLIIDLNGYQNISFFELDELQEALMSDIERASSTIRNVYYAKTVTSILSYVKKFEKNAKSKKYVKLMICATNLFSQQIIRIMMNTIDEITKSLADYRHRCPQLSIQLVWIDGFIATDPTIDQIYSLWHNIVTAIERVAENLLVFDEARLNSGRVDPEITSNQIKVTLPDWYMKKAHQTIDKVLKQSLRPLQKYFSTVVENFGDVSSPEMKQTVLELVSKNCNFDIYCSNVKNLTHHYEKANELIDNLYYDIGRLNQSSAKKFLRAYIAEIRGILVEKLLLHHREYNEKICQEFSGLEHEMLDIPKNAKELFELSEKISYTSRILVDTLETRVRKSIEMLSSLLELSIDLSDDHIELNSKTINWLIEIQPIFVRSNTLCESMKSELEDELQREINNLNIEIEVIIPEFVILDDMDDFTRVEEYVEHLAVLVQHVNKLDNKIKQINFEERLFKFPETTFPNVEDIRDILTPVYSLNNLMCEWRRNQGVWLDGPFEYINAEELKTKTLFYHERFEQLNVSLRAKIKIDIQSSASKPFKYSGVVDDPDPMQQPAPVKLCWQVIEDVEHFKQHLELICCVCNPALRDRHWEEMSLIRISGGGHQDSLEFTPNAGTTLRKLIALDLQKDIEKYQAVSIGANKELALSCKLQEMIAQWNAMNFTIVETEISSASKLSQGTLARRQQPVSFLYLDEIRILMEEHSIVIREMKVSYFVKPIAAELQQLSESIFRVNDMMEKFLSVQYDWFDLEPVFRMAEESDSPAKPHETLAKASKIFFSINNTLQNIYHAIMQEPKFQSMSDKSTKLLDFLSISAGKLEIVREAVTKYIQEIRNLFPRFYFLYDREVVRLVFEPVFSIKMKLLMKKCFSDIRSLRITSTLRDRFRVDSIVDRHDQELFIKAILSWEPSVQLPDKSISSFIAMERAIIIAVKDSIAECSNSLNNNCESMESRVSQQKELLLNENTIGMASLCSRCIYWTCRIEQIFESDVSSVLLKSLQDEQCCTLKSLIADLQTNLTRRHRKKMVSLITQIRDQYDKTEVILKTVKSSQDFNWKAQVRHYWENKDVKVVILDTESFYGYEYSACEKPLIATPLTDRCYRSIMEAQRNDLCGMMFGPTATGKTHCIKDLARVIAVRLYIYNCHENVINYKHISNIFQGLLECSSCWLFFKHVDLLIIQMQSVIAEKISTISRHKMTTSKTPTLLDFQETPRNLRNRFITGTISSKHSHNFDSDILTDSLKILFRPIAMTYPDTRRIIEVELFAEGFIDSALWARKIRLVEKYSTDQLFSIVSRYDFSIRSTKSVIKTACALKNRYPNEAEDVLILRALIDVHLPKFTCHRDTVVFQHIIEDIFLNVTLPSPNYTNLLSTLTEIRSVKYPTMAGNDNLYQLKIIQLFEMIFIRHAIVIAGPPLAGKTSIIDNLKESMTLLNEKSINRFPSQSDSHVFPAVETVRINHLALALEEIFGWYEDSFGDVKLRWKDGILTRALRSFVEEDNRHQYSMQWLILDGPLDDSVLFDKLGTLLDENKTLFLASGERIPINDSTSIIIETVSLARATPATISHCGLIYIEEATIGWKGLVRNWIVKFTNLLPARADDDGDYKSDYAIFLKSILEMSLETTLEFVYNRLNARIRPLTNNSHLVISMLKILEMYLEDALGDNVEMPNKMVCQVTLTEPPKWTIGNLFVWTQAAVLMAIIWGLGGALDRNSRVALDEFCASTWRTGGYNSLRPGSVKSIDLLLPTQGLIQDYIYVFNGTGSWRHWSDVLKKDASISNGLEVKSTRKCNYVPTVESVKYMHLFESHVKHRKPFILLGEMATGKTIYMRHLLKSKICQSICLSNFLSLGFAGSSYNSNCVQNIFLSKMTKLGQGLYGVGKGRFCVNFIDDLNIGLSSKNPGDQGTLELIRQYHDSSHWYCVQSGNKISLCDIMFLGAMTLDCSNDWNDKWQEPRFFRHFNLYEIDQPSNESIFRIYSIMLLANLRSNQFNADVSGSVNSMINATIEVYSSVHKTLRPVPSAFQYRFTLRDVGRVVTGCSFVQKDSVETKVTFIRLWVHEALRVFADRIVNPEDHEFLFLKIKEAVDTHFKDSFETAFDNLPKSDADTLTKESLHQLIFSDFMQLGADVEGQQNCDINSNSGNKKRYEEITCSKDALKNKAIMYLNRYNDSVTPAREKLDILILPGMLEHLIRICRILSIPGGSLLMICLGGSGRRSLTALASFLKGHPLHQLSHPISSSAGESWREDLKLACMSCIASTGQSIATDCTFFITDRQISEAPPSFLRDICSLMKTGNIPELFTTEERDSIVERSRSLAQSGDRNLEMNSLDVIDYFYNKCQEKLHFVMYFEQGCGRIKGEGFRSSFRDGIFNSIVSHCSIDCYENWPEESFYEIANSFMKDIKIEKDAKSKAVEASKYFYDSVEIWRGIYTNDRNFPNNKRGSKLPVAAYLHLVKLYSLLMTKKQNDITVTRKRYLGGLEKLQLAGEGVKEMKSILTQLRPELEKSAEETAETMEKIERENVSVENATIQVKREEQVANGIAKVAGILKEECEADLAVAIPILEDAIAALNTLKPTDITLVKAMKNPPDTVKLVLAAVCVMLNVSPDRSVDPVTGKKSIDYWAPSKRILGDMNFLQSLKDYDKDNIPSSVMLIINKTYMNDETFMPHIVAKASSAAEGLCKWVRAMVSYDEVAKVVAPKKEKLAGAERECNASLEYLNEKRKSLAALNDKLAALNAVLEATLAKKLQLEKQVSSCTSKLAKAEGLITSLAGEKAKWLKSADTLRQSYDCLAGDILLSSGIVALLGTFDATHRDMHIKQWKSQLRHFCIPSSERIYDFVGSLETDIEVNNWKQAGLSNNSLSQGNVAIMKNSLLWPICLDPENQANSWIRQMESINNIRVVKATDPEWLEEIKKCVEHDVPVLVENLERSRYFESTVLDHILSHLCPRFNCAAGTERNCIPESVSLNLRRNLRNFRFYVTIRVSLHEAALQSHIYKKMSVINFSLADEALEDRLLEIVVSREKPELQDTFDKLMASSVYNKRVLQGEEDKILAILSNSSSINIIEDERAIETLDYSRNLSLQIMRREEAARATSREMDEFRVTYRPLTKYCAALYDTVASISSLNHMYRFSLEWFTRLYVRSIDQSMKSVVLDKRLKYLKASFTEILHSSVRNALLSGHKLVYSFLLAIKILLDSKAITQEELRLFRNSSSFKLEQIFRSTKISSSNYRSNAVEKLSEALPQVFHDLPTSFSEKKSIWKVYCDKNDDSSSLPAPWNELSKFQQLILANAIKPDKTLPMMTQLIENTLGSSLSSLTTYNISSCFEESSCLIPLIFILPSYLEVSGIVEKWAKTMGYSSKVSRFSMGVIDDFKAVLIDDCIDRSRQQGGWVVLENCHLATDYWLAKLEKICENLDPTNTVLSFRLWLTSYPTQRFPISILQNSIKIHWENSCDSLKESLLRSYQSQPLDDPDFYNRCTGQNRTLSKLVYTLCFFHAIVRGRSKFGKTAWNVPYEFTDSDLKVSIDQLLKFLNNSCDQISTNFETLTYLIGECYYGGRILDPIDRIRLKTLLCDYCNPRIVQTTSNYLLVSFNGDDVKQRYFVPNRTEYQDYIKHINHFIPEGETKSEIFGLDGNASVIRNAKNSAEFNQALCVLFADNLLANDCNYYAAITQDSNVPKSCTNNVCYFKIDDRGNIESTLSKIIESIRAKLLQNNDKEILLDLQSVKMKYPLSYSEPLNALLIDEVESYNNLIIIIRDSLVDLERSYEHGFEPLFSTLIAIDELARDLIENRIPLTWMCMSSENGSRRQQSLAQFIEYLTKRKCFLNNWISVGHCSSFWLGGIVRCKKFISASRLMIARQCELELSGLNIEYEVLNIVTDDSKPWKIIDNLFTANSANIEPGEEAKFKATSVHIHGLFLSGARWDIRRSTLAESFPKLYWNSMPVTRFGSAESGTAESSSIDEERKGRQSINYYSCPVNASNTSSNEGVEFFNSSSNKYVTIIPLESKDVSSDHWIKRSTTLYCNKD